MLTNSFLTLIAKNPLNLILKYAKLNKSLKKENYLIQPQGKHFNQISKGAFYAKVCITTMKECAYKIKFQVKNISNEFDFYC